ncbi:MAG: hypothetical protein N2491_12680 [Negativicutes bacterium]|nr:hypothetical protein [Negativicutes bacterium]
MGYFFEDLCNNEWCEILECACGQNVLLFTADGFTFFGMLDRFEDGIVTLVPASEESEVIVTTPGGDTFNEDLSYIDICVIVALSKNVDDNPLDGLAQTAKPAVTPETDRGPRCKLIHILKRLQGEEDVIMRTIGGFQFDEGRLVRVEDCFAVATDVEVRLPGGDSVDVNNITINLCALTSVAVDDD